MYKYTEAPSLEVQDVDSSNERWLRVQSPEGGEHFSGSPRPHAPQLKTMLIGGVQRRISDKLLSSALRSSYSIADIYIFALERILA